MESSDPHRRGGFVEFIHGWPPFGLHNVQTCFEVIKNLQSIKDSHQVSIEWN